MAIESSVTREIGKTGEKKKSQLEWPSPELSCNDSKGSSQGDSDSESTSVTSSIQGSTSSATSSLDQDSVNGGTRQSKSLQKLNSKKFTTFGSFISSRWRAQSRLSQSSIKLSDYGSSTPQHSSSIEVSDESPNYFQKPMPKFTRTGSLRSVRIFKNKNKNKNKPSFKSKKSSIDKSSGVSEESHLERATFSSILKDSKFPEHLTHQTGPPESEEVLPVAKFCPYQHCSLHGHHHHHHEPPLKRFEYLKRRTSKDQKSSKPESRSVDKSSGKKREAKVTKKASNSEVKIGDNVDFSIEFYARTRSEPVIGASHDHDDVEFADILFGVNSFPEKNKAIPTSNCQNSTCLNGENDGNLDGSKSNLSKVNHMSMWRMIHRHMVSDLSDESGEGIQEEKKSDPKNANVSSQTKDFDDVASQETEVRKMFAIKLVREAIEKILLPEVQDDQSTTSEVVSEQDPSEKNLIEGEITSDQKELPPEAEEEEKTKEPIEKKTKTETETEIEKRTPKSWSYLKKVILLRRFVKELEKVNKFNPKKPRNLPMVPEPEPETVSLRRQTTSDKKNSDEWMLDYALQKVVSELAPTQKRKVSLLIKAFETVAPAQEDHQESRFNAELKRVGSEISESGADSRPDWETKSRTTSFIEPSEKKKESKLYMDKEKRIKMWHMIYQHVVTDIATKVGSDLLLDDEESVNSEDENLPEVEDRAERAYMLGFTQSDAVKLVRESVNEILHPDVSDTSSQEARSIASDTASDHEELLEPKEGKPLEHQKSKNWSKLKKLILVKRSIKALESFRKLKPEFPRDPVVMGDDGETVELRRQMTEERKKAEQWMLDYAVQHIVTKLTPARKKRVSMLVEAFEAVVPLPEI